MENTKYINKFSQAISGLNTEFKNLLESIPSDAKDKVQEIRLRANKPVCLVIGNKNYFLTYKGTIVEKISSKSVISDEKMLLNIIKSICDHSIYTYQEEIRNGFITAVGGHRIGICGTAVIKDGEIKNIKDISSINIRIAREVNVAYRNLIEDIGFGEYGVLIVGVPSSGKTTVLRSIAKTLSTGEFGVAKRVSIIDERGEIAGVHFGISGNDVGLCDVLNGYPKGEGLMHAIRALSPDIVICDEIGNIGDLHAIEQGLNAGVKIIASIHAGSLEELLKREQAKRLLDTGAFEKLVVLADREKPGTVKNIYGVDNIYAKTNRLNNIDSLRNINGLHSIA